MAPICGMVTCFISEHQRIVRKVLEQGGRRLARFAARKITGIVLDAGAGTGRLQHFQIEPGALFQPLCLQQPAMAFSSSKRPFSSVLIDLTAWVSVGLGVT